jgi:hypothetical protein
VVEKVKFNGIFVIADKVSKKHNTFHQLFWCRSLLGSSREMVSEITEKMSKANNFLYLLVLAPNRDLVIHPPPLPLPPRSAPGLLYQSFFLNQLWELFSVHSSSNSLLV